MCIVRITWLTLSLLLQYCSEAVRDEGSVPVVMVRRWRWRKNEECSDPGRQPLHELEPRPPPAQSTTPTHTLTHTHTHTPTHIHTSHNRTPPTVWNRDYTCIYRCICVIFRHPAPCMCTPDHSSYATGNVSGCILIVGLFFPFSFIIIPEE